MLSIENDEMEEAEIDGFISDQQSLYCGNVCGDMLVQVVPGGARLVDCNTLRLIHEFPAPSSRRITVATTRPVHPLLPPLLTQPINANPF